MKVSLIAFSPVRLSVKRCHGSSGSRQTVAPVFAVLLLTLCLLTGATFAQAARYQDADVADGFYKTVFGAEIKALSWGTQTHRVKKYVKPVKVWIDNRASLNRLKTVRGFVKSLPHLIPGLKLRLARTPKEANFRIYIVDSSDYVSTVQEEVFNNRHMKVPGQCIVRVLSRRSGILRSDAVIVSDQGRPLFRRCMVEEILQGLGPINDDTSLAHSVFNDQTTHAHFTRYDKLILNMLYSPSVKPGMTLNQVRPLTTKLLQYAKGVVGSK